MLPIYQFIVDYFHCAVSDIVHPAHPFHLVFFLELFCNALLLRYFFYKPWEKGLSLLVDVCEIVVELAGENKA